MENMIIAPSSRSTLLAVAMNSSHSVLWSSLACRSPSHWVLGLPRISQGDFISYFFADEVDVPQVVSCFASLKGVTG